MFGSRLPVGSSASMSSGRFTNARAIETRCCSPPDSSEGKASDFPARPTSCRICGTWLSMTEFGRPMTCKRKGDVLVHRLVREQLEILEDAADVSSEVGDVTLLQLSDVAARDMQLTLGRLFLAVSRRMNVDFPEPDDPTRNTNSPRWISQVMFRRATVPFR